MSHDLPGFHPMPTAPVAHRSLALPFLSITFVIVLVILIIIYPPLMVIAFDIAVIGGAILLVTIIANMWRHEIQRLGKMMTNLTSALNVHPEQQEECEQYYVLSSVTQSIQTLKEKKQLDANEKKQLRYLERQQMKNQMVLAKRGIVWTLRLLSPFHKAGYPTLLDNVRTIFQDPKFLALRLTLIVWFLFSMTIVFLIVKK
ncbi:MAG: hypothetical protein KBD15_00175 [Candidatus Magasanikbacteria bacterium]|nr:hypothetical protein [Candidatus Magasanikbacteria bacterium]